MRCSHTSGEFVASAFHVLHDEKLEPSHKKDDFPEAVIVNGFGSKESSNSVRVVFKTISGFGDGCIKVNSIASCDLSQEAKHANAAVLQFDVSKALELFLVCIGNQSKGIEETKSCSQEKKIE